MITQFVSYKNGHSRDEIIIEREVTEHNSRSYKRLHRYRLLTYLKLSFSSSKSKKTNKQKHLFLSSLLQRSVTKSGHSSLEKVFKVQQSGNALTLLALFWIESHS